MYAFNITGDVDHLLRSHDLVRDAGAPASWSTSIAWVSPRSRTCAAIAIADPRPPCRLRRVRPRSAARRRIRCIPEVWRLAGVDHLHVGGFNSKFYENDEEVGQSIRDCLTPLFGDYRVMPAISLGPVGRLRRRHLRRHADDGRHPPAGGGIIAHPAEPRPASAACSRGWEAALSGTPLADYARTRRNSRQPSTSSESAADGPALCAFYGDDFTGSTDAMGRWRCPPAHRPVPLHAHAGAALRRVLPTCGASAWPARAARCPRRRWTPTVPRCMRSGRSARRSRTTRCARPSIRRRRSATSVMSWTSPGGS